MSNAQEIFNCRTAPSLGVYAANLLSAINRNISKGNFK